MRKNSDWEMPIGKYKKWKLIQIFAKDEKYLEWASVKMPEHISRKVIEFLGEDLEWYEPNRNNFKELD